MTYSFGKRHYVEGSRPSDENNIRGSGWEASRVEGGHTLSFIAAAHGGREIMFVISEEEFERLRRDPEAVSEIIFAHGDEW